MTLNNPTDDFRDNDWDFMPMRFWVGMWTVGFVLIIVIFNLSALVKYITRFTEESFATLIAVIFIVEAFKKVIEIGSDSPVNFNPNAPLPSCACVPRDCNITDLMTTAAVATTGLSTALPSTTPSIVNYTCADLANMTIDWPSLSNETCALYGGIMEGPGCGVHYVADVFFFSILLFIGTFALALAFVDFKHTTLFPTMVRNKKPLSIAFGFVLENK